MSRALLLLVLSLLASCASCGSAPQSPPPASPVAPAAGSAQAPAATASLPYGPRPEGPAREWSPLGTNLDGPTDWSESIPLIDAFRMSREWTNAPRWDGPDDERSIELDEHGGVRRLAPGQVVWTAVLWDVPHARGGRYTVSWTGRGELDVTGGAQDRVVERTTNSMIVDWDPERDGMGFGIRLSATDPDDPVRQIRVIPPGGACREDPARFCERSSPSCACLSFVEHHESLVFHPDFLATLGSYGAIRFMNWQVTNDSRERTWADRPRLDDERWVAGLPPELLIDLSNRLSAHPWLCIPHGADDDYARELGRLVRQRLAPELSVRVELSNEIWNGIFQQATYARDEGWRRGMAPRDDPMHARINWTARRSLEVWRAFDEGFGERARTIHVLATQGGNPWIAEELLLNRATASAMDELAVAPYFGQVLGPDERDDAVEAGLEGMLERAAASIEENLEQVRAHVALAARHGARVVAYEGGQHYVGWGGLEHDAEVQDLLRSINRDPRMGQLYTRYLEGWREAGGTLFFHFVNAGGWGRYGSWGALEHVRQDVREAPKHIALERFARTTRPWW